MNYLYEYIEYICIKIVWKVVPEDTSTQDTSEYITCKH